MHDAQCTMRNGRNAECGTRNVGRRFFMAGTGADASWKRPYRNVMMVPWGAVRSIALEAATIVSAAAGVQSAGPP